MTFREKLANWISGGALKKAIARGDSYKEKYGRAKNNALVFTATANDALEASCRSIKALNDIVNMSTPKMAHIGKRMAKVALEALNDA